MAATAAALAAAAAPPRRPRGPRGPRAPRPPPGAPRRSGRVAGLPPLDPAGLWVAGADRSSADAAAAAVAPVYAREVYGPAALAALGSVAGDAAWALFVDGYDGKNKKRAHDPAGGSTCHQCRQKVRATFTACGVCGALRGVFCGDCLWMRYGEHVLQVKGRNAEAAAVAAGGGGGEEEEKEAGGGGCGTTAAATAPAPSTSAPTTTTPTPWACPPCRGLCNCSFHRAAAGLPPTGSLYRAALGAGFPSVAHFLVLSRLSPAGRAALAAAAGGPPPPAAWLGAGPGGTGSDDEDEGALATAAGLWARAVEAGTLGGGVVPPAPAAHRPAAPPAEAGGGGGEGGGGA
jgi:cell division cycle-associated protein 7